jgi:hypothetical protein
MVGNFTAENTESMTNYNRKARFTNTNLGLLDSGELIPPERRDKKQIQKTM